ncbi:FAD-dependent thymidylate synthase [bacterium D16-51]|nr:FAD-dependent thymidylate synthase [bacterium D16-59]RKI58822.1 FAD-dependent thymidylate synthase [bacterium D16-51]
MEKSSQAKIISWNTNYEEICASAARISTTKGNAAEIFGKAKENEKNRELIQKVLGAGHKSVIEHAVFTIAFCDVSAFVEQFFIESRLASFTVKSRRYVDFSSLGYYIPQDLKGKELESYCSYMDMLFSAYQKMLENGVPKEDARFLLPYSFHSNFYCTVNARELIYWIQSIQCGRGKDIPELQDLAGQLTEQIGKVFPCLLSELKAGVEDNSMEEEAFNEPKVRNSVSIIDSEEAGRVRMVNEPSAPLKLLEMAYCTSHPGFHQPFEVEMLFETGRLRELEQLSYSFLISDITLSGVTHIVRHRMQSILIPSIKGINHSKCILPDTVRENPELADTYCRILEKANNMAKQMSQDETLKKYSYYYALSGNTMDIMTTVNARELHHFMKLRTCNRAQWEIRKIAVEMLKQLRSSCPELFQYFGPSCYVSGRCPEGNLSCNKMDEVVRQFRNMEQVWKLEDLLQI